MVKSAPVLVDEVRNDIKSVATTTQQTLKFLRAILGFENDHTSSATIASSRLQEAHMCNNLVKREKRDTNHAHKRAGGKTTPLKIYEVKAEPPHPEIQRKIATEAFNSAIKNLTVVAKSKEVPSVTSSSKVELQALKQSTKPLQYGSSNRRDRLVRPNNQDVIRQGLNASAECGNVALDFLRQDLSMQSVVNEEKALQLEKGALALLDKQITLKVVDQAIYQMNKIHTQHWEIKGRNTPEVLKKPLRTSGFSRFLYVQPNEDKTRFHSAISIQNQALRLALLLGPSSVDDKLITALKFEEVGGPSWTVVEGLKVGMLDQCAAGKQLDSISLAMFKLYSLLQDQSAPTTACSNNMFELFCLASVIRSASWRHQDHIPDLSQAFWNPFIKAAGMFLASTQPSSLAVNSIGQHIRRLRNTLKTKAYSGALPPAVIDWITGLARKGQASSDLLEVLGDIPDLSVLSLGEYKPILSCKVAAEKLRTFPNDSQACLAACEEILKTWRSRLIQSRQHLDDMLVHGAQLRKLAGSVSGVIEQEIKNDNPAAGFMAIQVSTIRIVYQFVDFLGQYIDECLKDAKPMSKNRRNALLTTSARSVQEVFAAQKCAVSNSSELALESNAVLTKCLEVSDLILTKFPFGDDNDDKVFIFFRNVPQQISNFYWYRFKTTSQSHSSIGECIEYLEQSIGVLGNCSYNDQTAAYICLKYEKLSECYEKVQDYENTKLVLKMAIDFDVRRGVLSDAGDLLLTGSFCNTWNDRSSELYNLGKNVSSFAKLGLKQDTSDPSASWYYDDSSLPIMQRFVVLEHQFHLWKEDAIFTIHKDCFLVLARIILNLSEASTYINCRARFVSALLTSVTLSEILVAQNVLTNQLIDGLFDAACRSEQSPLRNDSLNILLEIISIQWAFLNGEMTQTKLETSSTKLSDLIQTSSSHDTLQNTVLDTEIGHGQLQALADYAGLIGLIEARIKALRALHHVSMVQRVSTTERIVSCLLQLGESYILLHDSSDAARELGKAEKLLSALTGDSIAHLEFALIHAEYLLSLSNFSRCAEVLTLANTKFQNISENYGTQKGKSRLKIERFLCHASYLASRLAFNQGDLEAATIYARKSVKLSTSIWLSIETFCKPKSLQPVEGISSGRPLAEHSSGSLAICDKPLQTRNVGQGAQYWSHVLLHSHVLINIASISAHHGLYQDANFYYQEVSKVADAIPIPSLGLKVRTELALLNTRAGQTGIAKKMLSETQTFAKNLSPPLHSIEATVNQAEAYFLLNDKKSARHYLDKALLNFQQSCGPVTLASSENSNNYKPLHAPSSRKQLREKVTKSLTSSNLAEDHNVAVSSIQPTPTLDEMVIYDRLQTLKEKLITYCNKATKTLESADLGDISDTTKWTPERCVARGLQMLEAFLEMISNDAVNNVLAETALAIPVRFKSRKTSGRTSFVRSESPIKTKKKDLKHQNSSYNLDGSIPSAVLKEPYELMDRTHKLLAKVQSSRSNQASSEVVHVLHKLLSQLALLSAALSRPFDSSSLQLVLQSLLPKDLARNREQMSIQAERANSERVDVHLWPEFNSIKASGSSITDIYSACSRAIELLPKTWSVITIDLNQDKNEIFISKITAKRSPFLVRIPLARSGIDDQDDNDFTFSTCKSELLDIMNQANATAHDIRGQGDRATRKAWYAERETLDRRLEVLLGNIENIWLGGFRGLLSTKQTDETSISKFGISLSQTLDKHLPSRQRFGNGSQTKVELHTHVLELFISIDLSQDADVENSVTDLLYFVIDILQFNGEQNAYDEIDFDGILVDVLDALRSYHGAIEHKQDRLASLHTILILDNELQSFPWESLPCLRGKPISRMPSLGALGERLKLMQAQSPEEEHYSIPHDSGMFMLNPSSDLTSTQETFQNIFESQLSQFSNLVGRVPSEQEFESCLRENTLFLYFGHGSGAQYIRGRTIRKLDQCAVTLLMGCSSSRLTECGVFEPYGMPWHYMHAKSPAVVGTLWDVTDRDIDRFAMKTMCEWGLLEEDKASEKIFSKRQGKSKIKKPSGLNTKAQQDEKDQKDDKRGVVALDEAVAKARDSCMLRFLNGAAPVIYGIPVMLK